MRNCSLLVALIILFQANVHLQPEWSLELGVEYLEWISIKVPNKNKLRGWKRDVEFNFLPPAAPVSFPPGGQWELLVQVSKGRGKNLRCEQDKGKPPQVPPGEAQVGSGKIPSLRRGETLEQTPQGRDGVLEGLRKWVEVKLLLD